MLRSFFYKQIEVEDRPYDTSELISPQKIDTQSTQHQANEETLNESTRNDLRDLADPKVVYRAKTQKLKIKYCGVDKKGIVFFKCSSGTIAGKWYDIQIKLKDLKYGLELLASPSNPFTQRSVVRMLQTGDILLHCTDPSWKYWGWQYIGTKKGYAIKKENRFPKIRNPRLTGSVCKHLYATLTAFPFYTSEIVRDYRRMGIFASKKKK